MSAGREDYADRLGFNPYAPRGGATFARHALLHLARVSIRAPRVGTRRVPRGLVIATDEFQSTLPARGRDPMGKRHLFIRALFRSTRLAMGRDANQAAEAPAHIPVSIHASRDGARLSPLRTLRSPPEFQSTRPARGRDLHLAVEHRHPGQGFNPRAPRGGATWHWSQSRRPCWSFNPRVPRGGATRTIQIE